MKCWYIFGFFVLLSFCEGHIEMSKPLPRGSRYGSWSNKDYDLTSPLNAQTRPFPCGGKKAGPIVSTIKAGESLTITLSGSAIHGGGHCQFGLSYKSSPSVPQDFVVLHTVKGNCMLNGMKFTFSIPCSAPSGKAVLFWTWINRIGNREYYMNCADVVVQGSKNGKIQGNGLFVANIPTPAGQTVTIPEWGTSGIDFCGYLDVRSKVEQGADGYTKVLKSAGKYHPPNGAVIGPIMGNSDASGGSGASAGGSSGGAVAGNCQNGAQKCDGKTSGWWICSHNLWIAMPCPPNLVCSTRSATSVECGFPKTSLSGGGVVSGSSSESVNPLSAGNGQLAADTRDDSTKDSSNGTEEAVSVGEAVGTVEATSSPTPLPSHPQKKPKGHYKSQPSNQVVAPASVPTDDMVDLNFNQKTSSSKKPVITFLVLFLVVL